MDAGIAELRRMIDEAKRIVIFTGAGISTESGIPDFRSPGGIWTKMRPIDFSDFLRPRRRGARPGGGASPPTRRCARRNPIVAIARWRR